MNAKRDERTAPLNGPSAAKRMAHQPLREWRGLPPGLRDQTPRVRPVLLTAGRYCRSFLVPTYYGYSLEYRIYIPGIEIRYRFPGELHTRFCTANLISVRDKVHQKNQKENFHHSGPS